MEHTQGLWVAYENPDNNGYIVETHGTKIRICDVYSITDVYGRDHGHDRANAFLIAAAPDLLKALKECVDDLERYASKSGPGPDKRLANAISAIRRAEMCG